MAEAPLRSAMKWARDLPARTALRCANSAMLNPLLMQGHENALARHQPLAPSLSGADFRIVEDLHRDGIHITSLDALGLPGSDEMMAAARSLSRDFAPEARRLAAEGQEFIIVPPSDIASRPEIFRWGLHERLLDIVESYLGLPAAYDGLQLIYTVADGKEAGPRRWHRDWEDRRTIKVAVYCNDVVAGGGPFQMIRRRDPGQGGVNGYRYMLADDAALTERLGPGYETDMVSCEGPAGTVIFCETAEHFHRGQPAHTVDRTALFHSYFARQPRHPFYCERSGISRRQIADLARPLNARQQACALWRRELPLPVRLIPPAGL